MAVFSIVWQFNDTFYAKLFLISDKVVISKRLEGLRPLIANVDQILDPEPPEGSSPQAARESTIAPARRLANNFLFFNFFNPPFLCMKVDGGR